MLGVRVAASVASSRSQGQQASGSKKVNGPNWQAGWQAGWPSDLRKAGGHAQEERNRGVLLIRVQ